MRFLREFFSLTSLNDFSLKKKLIYSVDGEPDPIVIALELKLDFVPEPERAGVAEFDSEEQGAEFFEQENGQVPLRHVEGPFG